jgi:hypothetical protein
MTLENFALIQVLIGIEVFALICAYEAIKSGRKRK